MSPPARTIAIKDMAAVIATGRFEAAKHWYARSSTGNPTWNRFQVSLNGS